MKLLQCFKTHAPLTILRRDENRFVWEKLIRTSILFPIVQTEFSYSDQILGRVLIMTICKIAVLCLLLGTTPNATYAADAMTDIKKGGVAPARPSAYEQIDFDSIETTGVFSPAPVKIKGYLLKAKTDGKSPGAILAPACSGLLSPDGTQIRPNYQRMAEHLNSLGITVLLVDGFNPRGFKEICSIPLKKSRPIDTETRLMDSLGGLVYLRGRGDVTADTIFMVTWGAAGSFQAMNKELRYLKKIGTGFTAAIMFYPDCDRVNEQFSPYAPIQMFVGEKDTWNPAASCLALAGRQVPGSASFKIKIYPDAHHGFDHPRLPSLYTGAAIGPVITGGNPDSTADAYKMTSTFLSRFIEIPDGSKAEEGAK